ncbi:hypothetical protein BJ684DRAFT_18082 [Piptocephalis cylindrospora]|uniref:Uncharacterized protein n=1 Tax=Piptocephalis cylindrospora TaxID=1907219 RepID=A0A4P9XY31_9FUNG|nr:hypothetical protein BJ684DRAFT_18082 [Piptocephalis cylindrospora]|eukprot:RKP11315.1 hypothetical protein BJ684DRAFT_18082 [Piptocephalis cylindrospora]
MIRKNIGIPNVQKRLNIKPLGFIIEDGDDGISIRMGRIRPSIGISIRVEKFNLLHKRRKGGDAGNVTFNTGNSMTKNIKERLPGCSRFDSRIQLYQSAPSHTDPAHRKDTECGGDEGRNGSRSGRRGWFLGWAKVQRGTKGNDVKALRGGWIQQGHAQGPCTPVTNGPGTQVG